jgi:hypothetical protein
MFRVVVAAYMVFVMAAGPLLCCCTTARLAASLCRSTATEDAGSAAGHCCCHHPQVPRGEPEGPQPPDRPRCPCQEDPSGAKVVLAPTSEVAQQLQQRHLAHGPLRALTCLAVDGCPLGGCTAPACRESPALPFLTRDHILRALHILRC